MRLFNYSNNNSKCRDKKATGKQGLFILLFFIFLQDHSFESKGSRRINSIGDNLNCSVLPVVFFFGIKGQQDHTRISGFDGIMRKISYGTSAGNLDIRDMKGIGSGIVKLIFDFNHSALLYKTEIIFRMPDTEKSSGFPFLNDQLRFLGFYGIKRKYPAHADHIRDT